MLSPEKSRTSVVVKDAPESPEAETLRDGIVENSVNAEPPQDPPAPPPSAEEHALDASIAASSIRGKVGYFFMYAAFSVSPYYGLLLQHKGFAPMAVGTVVAFMPLSVLVILSPLSYLADRYHCSMKIHMCGAVGSALLISFVVPTSSHVLLGFLLVLHFVFRTPVGPFMDQRTMSILPPDRKIEWGPMRSYGAYGWAFGALLISVLIGWSDWWGLALMYVVGMTIAMYVAFTIVPHDEPEYAQKNYLQVLRYVLSHRRLFTFLSALCCMGMGYTLISTFLFVFLDTINAPTILLGLSVVMTVVVEIPLFQCSKYIHEHYTDRQLLSVSFFAWSVRVTGYSFLYNPWLVLFLEPLHGFTFGLMWLSGMHFVRHAFPKSLSHSSIGFLSATAFGIGPVMGNLVGGTLYQHLGARGMFRLMALFMLCIGVVFLLIDRYLERHGYRVEAEEEEKVTAVEVMVESPAPVTADDARE
ncbi:MFS transporter, PPP family, 3-phenylpropionic acid transporter [Trypanosoma conorhini]|uniref:MFS transporter, PPP family, 3-phenylpropionic acid transporter n=1 Tax=Trypanosoma conorhini TaxID=83891 RepID=A0A3S5IQN2_9TRYP|nr:MFS transporter, PPP family, 3-phenylpropionic acid transporter [Trypanosoma conorhini]RNF01310.1 MFS transporter, PPP family, 3-phenylpropionic acid transporter [Trypanosoma conorhini]